MIPTKINSQVLEDIHYIMLPAVISESAVGELGQRFEEWARLKVEMHVFDFNATKQVPDSFVKAVKTFSEKIKAVQVKLVSLNMSDALFRSIKSAGADGVFNRVKNLSEDLSAKKKQQLSPTETRRLLFKYLAHGAFKAVDVALNSTVSCDENYSVKAEEVPLDKFDMISVIEVNNDFMQADFRLISSISVLDKLCRAMHGHDTEVDSELLESMALELLNMIYGHAKSNLNDKEAFRLPPAIPRLVRKAEFHRVKRSPAAQLTIMPVVTPMGSFYVEVDFAKTNGQ